MYIWDNHSSLLENLDYAETGLAITPVCVLTCNSLLEHSRHENLIIMIECMEIRLQFSPGFWWARPRCLQESVHRGERVRDLQGREGEMGVGVSGARIQSRTSDSGGVHGEEEDSNGVDRADHLAGARRYGDCVGRLRHLVHGQGFQACDSAATLRRGRGNCHGAAWLARPSGGGAAGTILERISVQFPLAWLEPDRGYFRPREKNEEEKPRKWAFSFWAVMGIWFICHKMKDVLMGQRQGKNMLICQIPRSKFISFGGAVSGNLRPQCEMKNGLWNLNFHTTK